MAHRLDPEAPVGEEIRRVLLSSLENARSELAEGPSEPAVHEARKAGKRARAAAELAEPALGDGVGRRLDHTIRDAARHLSEIRDGDVMRGWVRELGLSVAVHEVADREGSARRAAEELGEAASLARSAPFDGVNADTVTESLVASWDRARSAYRDARKAPGPEALHEWRKRAKRLMYQADLVSGRSPEVGPLVKLLDALQEELGTHHDLCVLHGYSPDPELVRRAEDIVPHVLACGAWLFRARGKSLGHWLASRPADAGDR